MSQIWLSSAVGLRHSNSVIVKTSNEYLKYNILNGEHFGNGQTEFLKTVRERAKVLVFYASPL